MITKLSDLIRISLLIALTQAQAVCKNLITVTWKDYTYGNKAKRIAAATAVSDVVYILGKDAIPPTGFAVQRYSPLREKWLSVANMGAVRVAVAPNG